MEPGRFGVKWADLDGAPDEIMMQERQARKISKLAAMLKRAGFVPEMTDDAGFIIYIRPDKPAPKRRRREV